MLKTNDPDFEEKLKFALWSTGSSSDYRNDRDRPYNGQFHTDHGERGKQPVFGLTMRDICDCIVIGFLESCLKTQGRVKSGKWRYQDVYLIDDGVDPIAVVHNATCNIEKMMGIYPNVPKLSDVEQAREINNLFSEE